MPIVPNFRKTTTGPGDIERKVSQFEDNTSDALGRIAQQASPILGPTNLKTSACTAVLDDLVECSGTFSVMLPVATPQNQGRRVSIVVQSGTISVFTASGLVQGVAVDSIPAKGTFDYISDGVGWWREGGVTSVTVIAPGLVGGGTGAVTVGLGTVTSANIDDSIATTTDTDRIRIELQYIRLLLIDLVNVELQRG